jgi:parallel beta-helix repeat protein
MRRWSWLLAVILVCGCGESDTVGAPPTITVQPGQSIQAAVDAAPPNSTIIVEPGTYQESPAQPNAVTISKDGIQLVGASTPGHPVILMKAGDQETGIYVAPNDSVGIPVDQREHPPCGASPGGALVHGFVLKGFTVQNFTQYGVYLACVDGFTLSNNVADGNTIYGLFPVRSHNGLLSGNEAENTPLDSALYVGQSDHVTLTGNSAHDNVQGLEIENSSDITCTNNQIFNNTAGIIADIMPGLQKLDQTNVTISGNAVHDNNRPNNNPPDSSTASTPQGTGIVVLGGSMVTVQNNAISNNGFAGVIMASYCSNASCVGIDVNPDPTNNQVLGNTLTNNGTQPVGGVELVAADLIWDGKGSGNCWGGNTPAATVKILSGAHSLPACP